MGLQQSKEELLSQQVNYGSIEGIRALRAQGAGLEWIDKEGRTPLIIACMRHDLLNVAKLLIELGANVNAYRPGSHAGTALHHAAKKGLEQTVHLLLTHGGNPFIMNDDCHTALDLAREKGHVNVVRAIEGRLSLFCGWLRENYGPDFLGAFSSQFLTRKIWVVVLPCDARNPAKPLKFELAVYPELQAAKPRAVIPLSKCQIEEPKFNHADPSITIFDKGTKTRYKFLSAYEGDKQQLQWFYNACCGIPQATNLVPVRPAGAQISGAQIPNTVPPNSSLAPSGLSTPNQEDIDLAIAINASIQSALAEGVPNVQQVAPTTNTNGWGSPLKSSTLNGWGPSDAAPPSKISGQPQAEASSITTYNGWDVPGTSSNQSSSKHNASQNDQQIVMPQEAPPTTAAPSAPPIADETSYNDPIQYPSIDATPINVSMPATEGGTTSSSVKPGAKEAKAGSSSYTPSGICVICLDDPVEAACIPCGHMAGCMSCLKDIEAKKWGCPICRAKIDQVVRLYTV